MPPWPQLLAVTRCRSCVDLDVCASPVSPPSVPSSIRASSALCAAASRPVFVILRRGGRPEPQVRAGRAPGSELTSLCCEIEFQTSNGPPLPSPPCAHQRLDGEEVVPLNYSFLSTGDPSAQHCFLAPGAALSHPSILLRPVRPLRRRQKLAV